MKLHSSATIPWHKLNQEKKLVSMTTRKRAFLTLESAGELKIGPMTGNLFKNPNTTGKKSLKHT